MIPNSPAAEQNKDQADAPAGPDFATDVQKFWEKNRTMVLMLCVVVLLVIIGFQGVRYFNEMRDQNAKEAYAKVATGSPERLAAFAAEYPNHPLAGVAQLQMADAKYSAGDFSAALAGYQKAQTALTNATLKARARLGGAVSRLANGDQAGAEADLKALGADASTDKNIRAEATFHLATIANEAGRSDEFRQLLGEVEKLDGMGAWAQRAMQLRAVNMAPGAMPSLSPKLP